VSPRRLRNTSYHRAPGSADRLAENQLVAPRAVRLAGLLKHRAFRHEREWRLVLPISPNKDKTNLIHPIRFRSTNSSPIPYIEFPLGVITMPQSTGAPPTPVLPINDVLLGPGTSVDAKNEVLAFLESKSVKIHPRRSNVPYRQV
jgi:hypothetical protein